MLASRTDAGVTVLAGVQYQIFDVRILGTYAAPDPADPSAPACAGCNDGACITYVYTTIFRSDGSSFGFFGPQDRQFVTWHGSTYPRNCPLVVPTQRQTWGAAQEPLSLISLAPA